MSHTYSVNTIRRRSKTPNFYNLRRRADLMRAIADDILFPHLGQLIALSRERLGPLDEPHKPNMHLRPRQCWFRHLKAEFKISFICVSFALKFHNIHWALWRHFDYFPILIRFHRTPRPAAFTGRSQAYFDSHAWRSFDLNIRFDRYEQIFDASQKPILRRWIKLY